MLEKLLEKLDPQGQEFITKTLGHIHLKGMDFSRTSKNPSSQFQSEGLTLTLSIDTTNVTVLQSGDITMALSLIEEYNLLIGFFTTGTIHSDVFKRRKHNLIERFNRLMSIKFNYERTQQPLLKEEQGIDT